MNYFKSSFYFFIIFLILLPITASAENRTTDWMPKAKKFDWIQLASGEWLKGELKSMYNNKLEFDSDKLDLLTIDWEDVKYLQSVQLGNVKIENSGSIIGVLTISNNKITIKNKDGEQEFIRDEIISFTPAGNHEIDLWTIKLTLGINLKGGNTKQVDYTAKLSSERQTANSRFKFDYIGNISKTDAITGELQETINNHRLTGALDIYVTRYFYYNPINAEYYRDTFQNIDQRITVGAGIGYVIKDTNKLEWNLSAGPAYITTKYISVQPGDDIRVDSESFAISTDIDAKLNNTINFIYKYNIQLTETKAGGYSHHMIATLESKITGNLDLDISFVWDRISHPTVDDLGIVPEPNDFRLILGISYSI